MWPIFRFTKATLRRSSGRPGLAGCCGSPVYCCSARRVRPQHGGGFLAILVWTALTCALALKVRFCPERREIEKTTSEAAEEEAALGKE